MGIQESSLRVGVDSSEMVIGARKGKEALIRLKIEVTKTERQFEKLEKQASSVGDIFAGITVGAVAREFTRLVDSTAKIDSKIRLVTDSTKQLNAVYDELLRISNLTGSELETNANVFNRLSNATRDLGLSYGETLDFTEDLNKLLKISGATTAETSSVMIQLSQALGAGALRGDEFNSVAEAMPKLLDLVTDELNRTGDGAKITRGELKNLASEGKITSDVVINAFKNASDEIDRDFKTIAPTIEAAFQVLANSLTDFVRDANSAIGFSEILSKSILIVADNVAILAGAVAGLAVVLSGQLVAAIARSSKALLVTPVGRIAAGFIALTSAVGAYGKKTVEVADQTATVYQVIQAGAQTISGVFNSISEEIGMLFDKVKETDAFGFLSSAASAAFGYISSTIKGFFNLYKSIVNGMINTFRAAMIVLSGDGWDLFVSAAELAGKKVFNAVVKQLERLINKSATILSELGAVIEKAFGLEGISDAIDNNLRVDFGVDITDIEAKVSEQLDSIKSQLSEAIKTDNFDMLKDTLTDIGGSLLPEFSKNLAALKDKADENSSSADVLDESWSKSRVSIKGADDATKNAKVTFDDIKKSIQREIEVLNLNGLAAEQLTEKYSVMDKLKRDLTITEENLLNSLVKTRSELELQKDILADTVEPIEALRDRLRALQDIAPSNDDAFGFGALNNEIQSLKLSIIGLEADAGLGGFKDGFILSLGEMTEGLRNWKVEAGAITGDFISSFSQGFGDAVGDAIWQTDNLGESLKTVARDAISQLVSSLVQVGVQMVANAILGKTLAATATGTTIASAAAIGAAWAVPAALASLASLGTNAASASAGIAGTVALTESLALFKDGGFVSGAGGPRDDAILARLSNGEFVVNASATAANRPMLEAMNKGKEINGGGGTVVMNIQTRDADSFIESQTQILNRQQEALLRAARRAG